MLQSLRLHARTSPGKVALREHAPAGWQATTWRELDEATGRAAMHAQSLRFAPRPAVLLTDNTTASVAVLLGLLLAGVGTICIERDSSYLGDDQSAVRRACPAAIVGPEDTPPYLGSGCPVHSYRDLLGGPGGGRGGEPARLQPDPATPVYQVTSGSTGQPRLARQSLGSVTAGGALYRDVYRYTAEDRILLPVPIAHSFGMVGGLSGALASGAELLLLPRFALSALHTGLRQQTSVVLGTPLIYRIVAATAPPPDTTLRLALSSGGPLAAEVATTAEHNLRTPIRQVYGSTETGLIACQTDRPVPWPEGSAGVAAPGVSWWIEPESGAQQGTGRRSGRLLVRTSTMFSGYLGDATAAVMRDGRYDTGDLACLDERGHLYLVGRKDTFINVGGRKVSPRRIERLIAQHASVLDVHVFGQEEHGEQTVHAAVVLADLAQAAQLLEFCRARLMPYEGPHQVHVVDSLPRNGMGKVNLPALLAGITRG